MSFKKYIFLYYADYFHLGLKPQQQQIDVMVYIGEYIRRHVYIHSVALTIILEFGAAGFSSVIISWPPSVLATVSASPGST